MKLRKNVVSAAIIVLFGCSVVAAETGTPAGAGDQVEAPGGGKLGVPTPIPPSAPGGREGGATSGTPGAATTTTMPALPRGLGEVPGGATP